MMPSSFQPSVFESLFNSALVGQVMGLFKVGAGEQIGSTIATGSIGANILAREVTQRLIAGQTVGQEMIRRRVSALGRGVELREGLVPSAVEKAVVPQGVLFSEDQKESIRNMPLSGKAALYRNLKAKEGSLERLKAEDPKFFIELEKAANAGR